MKQQEEEWISVDESLPSSTDKYKVKTIKGTVKWVYFICDILGGKAWSSTNKQTITHWQENKKNV